MQMTDRDVQSLKRRSGSTGAALLFSCPWRHGLLGFAAALLAVVSAHASSGNTQALFSSPPVDRRQRTADILHYRIAVKLDDHQKRVTGETAITFTPLSGGLDSLCLDAAEMEIRRVAGDAGREVSMRYANPVLTLRFRRRIQQGDTATVRIGYACRPRKGLYFVGGDSSGAAHREIWTQGEDTDNRYWFPCDDDPNDKATSEVIATVREDYTVVSNGLLTGVHHDDSKRTKTYHWRESKNHSSYLIMLAAGIFAAAHDRAGSVPLAYYVPPKDTGLVKSTFGETGNILRFFESLFAMPYPWEQYSQIVIDDFMWGGMENTTAVTLNEATLVDSVTALEFPAEKVIAHELVHMWWGDLVTVSEWADLWLHEGFATYCEALYAESISSADEFEFAMIESASQVRAIDATEGRRPIVNAESFPVNLYSRGAWVLHMLRDVLGEDGFLRTLRTFLARHAGGNVETADLVRTIRDVTGRDLTWFFDQWVFKAGYPKLTVDKIWNSGRGVLSLRIAQTQVIDSLTGIFRFPLHVQITTDSSVTDTTLSVREKEEQFDIPSADEPRMVIVDKGYHLLKEMVFTKPVREHEYQLLHAEDVADRVISAYALSAWAHDTTAMKLLAESALRDPFWGVRQASIVSLGDAVGTAGAETYRRCAYDRHPSVRTSAVHLLCRYGSPGDVALVDSIARHDTSVLAAGAAVSDLAELDSVMGRSLAVAMLTKRSYRNIIQERALSALTGLRAADAGESVFPLLRRNTPRALRMQAISFLGEVCRESKAVRKTLVALLDDHDPLIRVHVVQMLGGWDEADVIDLLRRKRVVEHNAVVLKAYRQILPASPE
jgi:aminopeptidase N